MRAVLVKQSHNALEFQMIIFIIVVSVILMAIFMATTIAGGRYHDEQKAIRDRADMARAERLHQEASADLDRRP